MSRLRHLQTDRLLAVARAFVGLALLACVLGVLLEASARLVLFGLPGLDPRRVGIFQDLDPAELVTFETERTILYEYKPNLDVFFHRVPLRTNSRGMRDRKYPLRKPPGTYRVAVLGSSFTLPAGVEIEDAFHSLLEERLSAEFAPTSYEFLNFAVGLHGPGQFTAMLQHRALAFEPDLIVFPVTAMAAPRLLSDWRDLPPRNLLDLVASRGPRSWFLRLVETRLGRRPPPLSTVPPESGRAASSGHDVVTRLGEISRETEIPIVVLRLELDPGAPTSVERHIERRAETEGLFYVDTRHAFRGKNPRDFWVHELDPHPNRDAHAIFADVLDAYLRDRDLLGR